MRIESYQEDADYEPNPDYTEDPTSTNLNRELEKLQPYTGTRSPLTHSPRVSPQRSRRYQHNPGLTRLTKASLDHL